MIFDLDGFKNALHNGFLRPCSQSYDYVDVAKFEKFQRGIKWKNCKIEETFQELRQRLGRNYYKNIVLAQSSALNYAALQFPAYSFLLTDDLTDDWLAIVDFHKKHARDHSLHQPLTAYVAAKLLGFGVSDDSLPIPVSHENLLDFCVDTILTKKETRYILDLALKYGLPNNRSETSKMVREFWKKLFYRTVVLSALFHDIGYPWQYVDRIGSSLRKSVNNLHQGGNVVSQIIDQYKDRMVFLPLRHYGTEHINEPVFEKEDLEKLTEASMDTHGFLGAIAFLTLNDAIRNSVTDSPLAKIHQFTVEWAAMGIFMHDMEGKHTKMFPKLRLSFEQDPLSSMIALADYLEEFNRPKAQFNPRRKGSKTKYRFDCSQVEVEATNEGVLKVEMKYKKNASKAIAAKFKTEETENYFNPTGGYVDLSPLGIRKVEYVQV